MRFKKCRLDEWIKSIDLKTKDSEPIDNKILAKWHDEIKLPKQGAEYSMGCDFFAPYPLHILPHNQILVPTGIKWVCDMPEDKQYGLLLVPRSGLGFKYGLRLVNTIGIIDSTFWQSKDGGQIMAKLENSSDEVIDIPQGKAFMQGLVVPYIVPEGAESDVQRDGGFGSTDEK